MVIYYCEHRLVVEPQIDGGYIIRKIEYYGKPEEFEYNIAGWDYDDIETWIEGEVSDK